MSVYLSKETTYRLLNDIKQIMKEPLIENGIYYVHDSDDMLKGYALIVGPSDTPYFGGYYLFEFKFPTDYPFSPPKVTYYTNGNNIRFNPNLYKCGKVCVSLLNTWSGEQWTSCQTISTVLLTLCTLLSKDPFLNEPGVTKNHNDFNNYNKIIEFSNIDIAVCDVINKRPDMHVSFFDHFSDIMKENFDKNYDSLIKFIDEKIESNSSSVVNVTFYHMYVDVDYKKLKYKLMNTKNQVKNNK